MASPHQCNLGQSTRESVQISRWESEDLKIARRELHVNYRGILDQIAFVEDPNGYFVELVPQNMKH